MSLRKSYLRKTYPNWRQCQQCGSWQTKKKCRKCGFRVISRKKVQTPKKLPRMASYEKYLKSPHWQKTRKNYFKKNRAECVACGSIGLLHLHHATYRRMGIEEEGDLVALCEVCHKEIHHIKETTRGDLYDITWQYILDYRDASKLSFIQ